MAQHSIGVVGATGVVGQQLLVALGLRDVGPEAVRKTNEPHSPVLGPTTGFLMLQWLLGKKVISRSPSL